MERASDEDQSDTSVSTSVRHHVHAEFMMAVGVRIDAINVIDGEIARNAWPRGAVAEADHLLLQIRNTATAFNQDGGDYRVLIQQFQVHLEALSHLLEVVERGPMDDNGARRVHRLLHDFLAGGTFAVMYFEEIHPEPSQRVVRKRRKGTNG